VQGAQAAAYDFEFYLCDSLAADCTVPLAVNSRPNVAVTGGVFAVTLDFGESNLAGADTFLQIRVKRPTETNYETLLPRQKITSAPYSIQSKSADNANRLGNVAANQYVLTNDSRLDANNYVQNTTVPQTSVNFNIGGTGTANIFNAAAQFNLGGSRVLSNPGQDNMFAGINTGSANTTGVSNAFFGSSAGGNNTTGANNSALGSSAGSFNTTGSNNVFIGFGAGRNSTTGSNNIFIGFGAGTTNTATQVTNSIGIGNNISVSASNTIVLGTSSQVANIPGRLEVSIGGVRSYGVPFQALVVDNLLFRRLGVDVASSSSHVCFRLASIGSDGGNALTSCITPFASSESKKDIQPFTGGLDIVKRLKPVAFKWKTDGSGGIGLNAEDVAAVAPQIVTRNEQGAVQEVNENSLNVVLINAVKEQQKQIEAQQKQIDALKQLVCAANSKAQVCQEEQK
jgi:Chaperone of endosialidase